MAAAPLASIASADSAPAGHRSPHPHATLCARSPAQWPMCVEGIRLVGMKPQLDRFGLFRIGQESMRHLDRAVDAYPGGLGFGIFVKRVQRLVAPYPAFPVTPKRHGDVVLVILVDMHRAGPQRPRHAVRLVDVTRPHRRLQAVNAGIGQAHHLGGIGK